jgi:hypothetical protein
VRPQRSSRPTPPWRVPALWLLPVGVAAAAGLDSGQWELDVRLQGAPVQDPPPSRICLGADQAARTPEQALLEAAMRSLPAQGSAAPRCALDALRRDGAASSWQARCDGPRGPLQGAGRATLRTRSATLEQSFELDTPIGRRTLKQTIQARHLGECS